MDGYDDYVDACLCNIHEPSDKTSLMFYLDRLMPNRTKGEADWVVIPIDHCVVVSVSSPFIDRTTNMLSSPSYISLRDGMGVESVTQYVDLIGGSHG